MSNTSNTPNPSNNAEPSKDSEPRAAAALETIARYYSQEETWRRERRLRFFMIRTVGLLSFAVSGVIASWELANYAYEQWQIAEMAKRYATVGAEIYYRENNPEVAGELVAKALELEKDNPDHRYLQAYLEGMAAVRVLLNLDRPYTKAEMDQAHQAMANAVFLQELAPDRPEPYILQSQLYTALKQYERAQSEIEQALAIDPEHDFALVRLAVIQIKRGEHEAAQTTLDQALSLAPNSKWAWLWKGYIFAQDRETTAQAREAYAQAIDIDPRFDLAYYNRAWTWLRVRPQDHTKAREDFEQALSIKPDYKEALYGLGMVYGYQDRYGIAERYLSQALEIDELFLTAWKWRGIVREEMGEYAAALEDFTQAIDLDPSNASLYTRRGRIYQRMENIDAALSDLRLAADFAPKNPRIWFYLGRLYAQLGQHDNALANLNRALALNPGYSDALLARARLHGTLGEPEKALADYNQAIEKARDRVERFHLARGDYFVKQEDWAQALADYRIAREQAVGNAAAWAKEAEAAHALKRFDEALTAVERALALTPQDEALHALREKIRRAL